MALPLQIDASIPVKRAGPGAMSFAVMYALESVARATLSTVIPLQAYAILREARDVSALFLCVAAFGLAASFAIPLLVRQIGRRWVYPLGGACLILCAGAFATGTLAGQVAGMLLRVFGAACLNITLSLYIMDYISKRDLVRSEPRKFLFSAGAWTIGPSLGVFLNEQVGGWSAFIFSGFFSLLLLVNFWRMRLRDDPAVARATRPSPNAFASIGRFVRQPRLRLAWAIAFARTCWWGTFLNYLPLFVVSSGVDAKVGGLMVSCGNAMLFLTPLWGRIGARIGLRAAIIVAFIVAGATAGLAWLTAPWPLLAGFLMVAGALGATCLDALGTIPLLRSVHPYERPQMVTVYRTNQDAGDFVSNIVLSFLLSFYALPAAFLAAAVMTLTLSVVSRKLPRSM